SLYLDKLIALQPRYREAPERGPKTPVEDAMVGMYPHCTFNLNPRAASIDTPLHAFVAHKHVDHTHPNAVIAVAAAKHSEKLTREIYGDDVVWTPWQRPGFDLGLKLQEICKQHPKAKGVLLGQHGLINWADDDRACYELSLELIERAARFIEERDRGAKTFGGAKYADVTDDRRRELLVKLLPWLRGRLSGKRRMIGTVQDDAAIRRFVNSTDAPRLAAAGGVRHRVLAAGGGEAQADAAGEGAGPAGGRGRRGRQRHRPGGRPAAGQGRGARRVRGPERRRRPGDGQVHRAEARHRH